MYIIILILLTLSSLFGDEPLKLTGRVVLKDDPRYHTSRLVSNYHSSKNKFPKVIVYCQNQEDVQNAIVWAKKNKMEVRIRSGGHNHEGYSVANDALIIDVSEMKSFSLDKAKEVATLGPGLTNQELYDLLLKEGLTFAGGTCSEVGLSGIILSGGMGPLLRRVGLTCDTLLSVDVVDADGVLHHATKDNDHKDLFWAICGGGGGNFGIITAVEMKVFKAEEVTWFSISWDKDQNVEALLEAWQQFFSKGDREWISHLDLRSPIGEEIPYKILGFYWGDPAIAKEKLSPLLALGHPRGIEIEKVEWGEALKFIEERTATPSYERYKSSGAFAMDVLPENALKALSEKLEEKGPLFHILAFSMGGATADRPADATAYYYRNAKFFYNFTLSFLKEEDKKGLVDLRNRLEPFIVGDYVGNPDADLKNPLKAYYGDNLERLECIKGKYDPKNFFHFEQSIPPKLNCP